MPRYSPSRSVALGASRSTPSEQKTKHDNQEEEEEEDAQDWDHGWALYSRYGEQIDAEHSQQQHQQDGSSAFDASLDFNDTTDATLVKDISSCKQHVLSTAAGPSVLERPLPDHRHQHFVDGDCNSKDSSDSSDSSRGNKLGSQPRTLIPLAAPGPSLARSPLTSTTTHHHIHTSAAIAPDLTSEFRSTCRSSGVSVVHRRKNSKIRQTFILDSDSSFPVRGPSNWVSFNLDPIQNLISSYDSHHSSPPTRTLAHQRRSKLAGPYRIDSISTFSSVEHASQRSKMTDTKRASIDTPATPLSYATASGTEPYDGGIDTTATTPTHPHFQRAQLDETKDISNEHRVQRDSEQEEQEPEPHAAGEQPEGHKVKKDLRFWMIFAALLLISLIAALDMTMISTALPAIVADLPTSSIAANWVTSAFLLPMTASQPIFGGLSCSIGRKWSMNSALVIFLVGSVVCATAKTFLVLVVGRGIQGLGGGGIHSCCEIIMSDLTTLRERGLFFGLIAVVFALAGFTAPVLGGVFSEHSWPWIFWINLPIGAAALIILFIFLDIKVPLLTGREKWQKLDLVGNAVLFGSVTSILIAVTEGGIKYHWSSPRIWVPLVVGVLGLGLFFVIEWIPNRLSRKPVFPLELFQNRTSAFAYLQTFIHGLIYYGIIYMIPIYFQSIKDRTPLQSAIWTFPLNAPSFPLAMIAGAAISLTGKFKLLIFIGWIFVAAGLGWMTRWDVATSKVEWAFSQMIAGAGLGILFPITLPPIQAALPSSRLESATAAYAFTRTFGSVWGITAATTIFSTQAVHRLKPHYPQLNPLGLNDFTVVAYSENLRHLPQPLRHLVKVIYAKSIADSFWLFVPLAIIGFFTTFAIRELPLPDFIKSDAKLEQREDAIPVIARGVDEAAVAFKAEVPSTMP